MVQQRVASRCQCYEQNQLPPTSVSCSDNPARPSWLCCGLVPVSYRDVEDPARERGVVFLTDDTALGFKVWAGLCPKTETITPSTRRRWHLDEVFSSINGKRMYLWRAVDSEGEVLDILVQSRRNKKAALKLMRKLLKKQGYAPNKVVTDKLPSYGAALRDLNMTGKPLPADGAIIGRRIRTCRFDNENAGCRASSHQDRRKGFSPPTPPSTTPSMSNVI